MGRQKGFLSKTDEKKFLITRSILVEVFVNDRDNEYGVRDLHGLTGLPVATLSTWLNGDHNDIASRTDSGKWKSQQQIWAHDVPLTWEEQQEINEARRYDMKTPRV